MPKFSTSTYLKALSLVALALYFTNCAPKGPSAEAKLKSHCLKSMDPKEDFLATAEKLSENAKVRIVTSDFSETTLRDDRPIEETTIDPNIVVEKSLVDAKQEVAKDLLPQKYCGLHQIKLADGTVARITSISKSHLEATWTDMKKTSESTKSLESVNSITYRYIIDPETKNEYLEITEMNLENDRKKMIKKDVYVQEKLPEEIKMKASVLIALGNQMSTDFIQTILQSVQKPDKSDSAANDEISGEKLNEQKLTLTPKQRELIEPTEKEIVINNDATVKLSPRDISKLKNYITDYVKASKQRVKVQENTVDIDSAEIRTGDPSADKSIYEVKEKKSEKYKVNKI